MRVEERQDQIQNFFLELLTNVKFRELEHSEEFADKLCKVLHQDSERFDSLPGFLLTCGGTWDNVKQDSQAGKYAVEACKYAWCKVKRVNRQQMYELNSVLTEAEIDPETCVVDGWTLAQVLYSNGNQE